MKKKVLIISTSLRRDSNSELLARQFARGAEEAGNQVETISLRGKDIQFCVGCMACLKNGRCAIQDDAGPIVEKMREADVICFATPVYYYEMSGQMKTLLDRANSLFNSDYTFREVYLLTASAEAEDSASEGAVHGLSGWVACYPKCRFVGVARGGGADAPGEMKKCADKLAEAYEMGKAI